MPEDTETTPQENKNPGEIADSPDTGNDGDLLPGQPIVQNPTSNSTPNQNPPNPQTTTSVATPNTPGNTSKNKYEKYNVKWNDGKSYDGLYINQLYSLCDEHSDEKTTFECGKTLKISCFFAYKCNTQYDDITNTSNKSKMTKIIPYGDKILKLVLSDRLDSISLRGYVQIKNSGSAYNVFLERHDNFYFIINITQYITQNGQEKSIKLQPYIFDISKTQNISHPSKQPEKIIRLHLVDYMTSILSTHSFCSLIKHRSKLLECDNYKDLYAEILEYVKQHMVVNLGQKYQIRKDLLFKSNTVLGNKRKAIPFNGYDADMKFNGLIRASIAKIDRNATILQGLQIITRQSFTSLRLPKRFTNIAHNIGNVLIPFFFKQQYCDFNFDGQGKKSVYNTVWGEAAKKDDAKKDSPSGNTGGSSGSSTGSGSGSGGSTDSSDSSGSSDSSTGGGSGSGGSSQPARAAVRANDTTPPAQESAPAQTSTNTQTSSPTNKEVLTALSNYLDEALKQVNERPQAISQWYNGKSQCLLMRQMTMRDIFMPFYLCFAKEDKQMIWQNINPEKNKEETDKSEYQKKHVSMFKDTVDNITSLIFEPVRMELVQKRWKNLIFLDCSSSGTSTNCTLIYFDWFYRFFLNVFLNSGEGATHEDKFISNVLPTFYLKQRLLGYGSADKQDGSLNNRFDQHNSYTYTSQTNDTIFQCMRQMGKQISALILLNDMYTFTVKGQLFRRPNQIIKLASGDVTSGDDVELSLYTGLSRRRDTLLYVQQVIHVFEGNTYNNVIKGTRFLETFVRNTK